MSFPSCSLSTWLCSKEMMQGCARGPCLGSSWGESRPERSQQPPCKQSCDLLGSGLAGWEVVLHRGGHTANSSQHALLQMSFVSLVEHWEVPLAFFSPFLLMWFHKLHCKLFHPGMDLALWSEQAQSIVMNQGRLSNGSLLPFDIFNQHCLFFSHWILNILKWHPFDAKMSHCVQCLGCSPSWQCSQSSPNKIYASTVSSCSVAPKLVVFNWPIVLNRKGMDVLIRFEFWKELLDAIYYAKKQN